MSKFMLIADSSCDLYERDMKSDDVDFRTVPLSITVGEEQFTDDETLDTRVLMSAIRECKDELRTACPSPMAFEEQMKDSDEVICVCLSSKLSGTYNSARLAMENVKKDNPKKKIFVLDSLLCTGGMILILKQLKKLIEGTKNSFEEIVEQIKTYAKTVTIRFVLQDLSNLVKTGRLSKVSGIIANILSINLICGDNGDGEIRSYAKVIGTKKVVSKLCEQISQKEKSINSKDFPIVITHCLNEEYAQKLKTELQEVHGYTNIEIYKQRGLASFYSNDKGLTVSF